MKTLKRTLAVKEEHLCTLAEIEAAIETLKTELAATTDEDDKAAIQKKIDSYGEYTKAAYVSAPDFVGGFHGDEIMLEDGVKFYLDGVEIKPSVAGTYNGKTHFEFVQDSVINRCDEEESPVCCTDSISCLIQTDFELTNASRYLPMILRRMNRRPTCRWLRHTV